jgi:hypothetical protein
MGQAEWKGAREALARARADADRHAARAVAAERARLEAAAVADELRGAEHARDEVRSFLGKQTETRSCLHAGAQCMWVCVCMCVGGWVGG